MEPETLADIAAARRREGLATSGFHTHEACVSAVGSTLSIIGHGTKNACAVGETSITIVVKDH